VLKRLQWRWKDFSGASKFKKLHSSVVITLFLIINSYSVSTKKCHKMRHFDKNIQNFLRRGHLESTKIRHFNPKIFKKFSAKGNLPRPLPLCVYIMQMLQENIEGRFFLGGELLGKVQYYYCSVFLIYLRYLASRSVL